MRHSVNAQVHTGTYRFVRVRHADQKADLWRGGHWPPDRNLTQRPYPDALPEASLNVLFPDCQLQPFFRRWLRCSTAFQSLHRH